MPEEPRAPRRRGRRAALIGVLVVLATVAVAAGWIAWTGVQARGQLSAAQDGIAEVQAAALEGDLDAARGHLDRVQARTATAHDLTSDPVWSAAALAPVVGDDVRAVSTMAAEVDVVAEDVLPAVVDAAEVLAPASLRPADGAVRLEPFTRARPLLDGAVEALDASDDRVRAIDGGGLIGPVAAARTDLLSGFDGAAGLLEPAATAAELVPGMLGADGPRDYLVLFQNNAEVRTTGGMPGAVAVVRADGGRLSLVEQSTAGQLTNFDPPVPGLPADTAQLFEEEPAVYFQDVNFTADFPLAASLARTMYAARTGTQVSGVLATDPVALSYLLAASGPVEIPGGPVLTAENAVEVLLNDLYVRLAGRPLEQDAVYAAAAATVFDTVTGGEAEPRSLLEGLGRAAQEGRLLLWSADPAEQQLIADTALAGPLRPGGTGGDRAGADPSTPVVGVFLNGAVSSKLDYYLRQAVTLSPPTCRIGDLVQHELVVELTSTAPADAATSLPPDVLGPATLAAPGVNRVQVLVYAPVGASFGQVREDGEVKAFGAGTDGGRPVAQTTVPLDPQETTTLQLEVLLPGPPSAPVVRTTPLAHPSAVSIGPESTQSVPVCG